MQEPSNTFFVLVAFIVALLGPVLGPLVLLVFAAAMGSLLAMSKTPTPTRWDGAKFIAVGVGISFVMSGLACWLVEKYTPIPGNVALMPVAFAIAASRNSVLVLIDKGVGALTAILGAFGSKGGSQ